MRLQMGIGSANISASQNPYHSRCFSLLRIAFGRAPHARSELDGGTLPRSIESIEAEPFAQPVGRPAHPTADSCRRLAEPGRPAANPKNRLGTVSRRRLGRLGAFEPARALGGISSRKNEDAAHEDDFVFRVPFPHPRPVPLSQLDQPTLKAEVPI